MEKDRDDEKAQAAEAKKKAAAEEKARKAQQKAKAVADYQGHLAKVKVLQTMTDTDAWQSFYRSIQERIAKHGREVLDAEKTREIIQHQEGVKILRDLLDRVAAPVRELQHFINAMPLFSQEMRERAEWNAALGRVEITAV